MQLLLPYGLLGLPGGPRFQEGTLARWRESSQALSSLKLLIMKKYVVLSRGGTPGEPVAEGVTNAEAGGGIVVE